MNQTKIIAVISAVCASVAGSSVNAATIPAGTTLTVNSVSLITSQDAVGSSFEAKIAQDVSVKGSLLLTTVVNPKTLPQFQLLQPVTL